MPVSEGLATTFDYLARTENQAAVQVLIPALDSPDRAIQEGALHALLRRRSLVGQNEILRRLHLIDDRWKAIIEEHRTSMSHALRHAVLDVSPQLAANGCQAILWLREYDLLPALINALEDEANPNAALAAKTALELVDLFYAELTSGKPSQAVRDPDLLRQRMTNCLEESVRRFTRHRRLEVIEAFLTLAAHDNATLKQILLDPLDSRYLTVIDALTHSPRCGARRLVLDFLEDPHAPSAVLALIAHRSDFEFIELLLDRIGREPSTFIQHNLTRIGNVTWLHNPRPLIDRLDDGKQQALVQLVMASSMNRLEAFQTIAYLIVQGKSAGRRAAAMALAEFHGVEANQLALKALLDDDDEVQARAIRQLRDRGIPGAISILLDMLASPSAAVQAAARESLSEFRFPRFLASFDMLDEEVRSTTGKLVRKIDPSTIPLLEEETHSLSRRRRIRALQMASAIEAVAELQDSVLRLLIDEDHLVRVEAARALGQVKSLEAYAALSDAKHDRSLTVREAAAASLEKIAHDSPGIALLVDGAQRQELPHG